MREMVRFLLASRAGSEITAVRTRRLSCCLMVSSSKGRALIFLHKKRTPHRNTVENTQGFATRVEEDYKLISIFTIEIGMNDLVQMFAIYLSFVHKKKHKTSYFCIY